ncbi:hypothetical protein [Cupriavidus metallidurans]|jgi:hypothetical protein|uniref:Uncharacterized protein n=1 Tax=Cupriavidus metallidurans TaxID=119219 RepID=A0A482IQC6_9BURK|nr:hypothetical protein [Cupriavidus metallidurans]QBP10431.1 hypothetical protein DDF84_012045 [Cupriavidus metallidurans]QWC87505.1 hypothetical protein KB891_10595 [Cupriavidus metallidurans]
MAINYAKFFAPAVLATGAAVVRYTMPLTPGTILLRGGRVSLTNTTAASVTPTLYAVPNGGSPVPGNVFFNLPIGPLQTVLVDVPVLGPGDTLQDKCDTATAVTIQAMAGGLFS